MINVETRNANDVYSRLAHIREVQNAQKHASCMDTSLITASTLSIKETLDLL